MSNRALFIYLFSDNLIGIKRTCRLTDCVPPLDKRLKEIKAFVCLRSDLYKEEDVHTTQPLKGKYAHAKFQISLIFKKIRFWRQFCYPQTKNNVWPKLNIRSNPKTVTHILVPTLPPPSHFHLSKNKISEYLISCHPI